MNHIDLSTVRLASGSHSEAAAKKGEACLLEWSAIFAGVPYSDHPECTSPVLGAFGRALNDGLDDERRQKLVPFIPRLVGTAGDAEADRVRAWLATDWLVRTFTPTWLRKAGLTERADELVALPELTSAALAIAAMPIIEQTRKDASAAWDAARDAAWDAAWDAARDAAWDAAWDAARAAARAAAWDAARDAAWDAAGAAARAAAWAAAWDAAGAAAGAAAWDAAGAAASKKKGYSAQYDAAYRAARPLLDVALRETTDELLESALALFGEMCDVRSAVPA